MATSPGRWTTDDEQTLRELHGQGLTLTAIAKQIGRDKGSVSRKAKALGLSWDRSHTAAATQAKVLDAKARRAQLKLNLLEDATRLREQLWKPAHYIDHGGKDFDRVEWTQDEPTYADKLKLVQAVSAAIGSYDRLEKLDGDGGVADAVGMLDKIADAIKAAAEAQR